MQQEETKPTPWEKAGQRFCIWLLLTVACYVIGAIALMDGHGTLAGYVLIAAVACSAVMWWFLGEMITTGKGGMPFSGL